MNPVQPRVVIVDGVPMSGLLAEADGAPRAVVVALHGGATTSAYFDCPGHPWLSLVRTGPRWGFTILALDRPGFGSSDLYSSEFDSVPRRIDMTYRAIDAILGDRDRGAGVFVLAHSNGSELALRMAAEERGDELLGLEPIGVNRSRRRCRGGRNRVGPGVLDDLGGRWPGRHRRRSRRLDHLRGAGLHGPRRNRRH